MSLAMLHVADNTQFFLAFTRQLSRATIGTVTHRRRQLPQTDSTVQSVFQHTQIYISVLPALLRITRFVSRRSYSSPPSATSRQAEPYTETAAVVACIGDDAAEGAVHSADDGSGATTTTTNTATSATAFAT